MPFDPSNIECVGDLASLQRGNTYKSTLLGFPGPTLLGLASIARGGGFRSDNLKTYGGDSPEKLLLNSGDLYVSLKDVTQAADLLGAVARVPAGVHGRLTQDTVKLVVPGIPDAWKAYLYWLLRAPEYRAYCKANSMGTTNLSLSREDFLAYPVPPLSAARQHIVAALENIEARIDHNRTLAANLEAIARALFKSWFVDFGPVRAKAAGEILPGLAPDLAALFPDRFVDSELGEIPEGWSVKTLGDAFELNPRRSLSKGSLAPYLDMASTPTKGHVPDQSISREFSSGSKFMNGDTLLARITPCLENGKAAFVDFLDKQEVGWGSTEFIVLRPKAPLPPYFGYLLARYAPFKAHAISSMSGTSGRQRVQPDSLATWELAVPDEAVAEAFGAVVEPLRAAIACANEESRVLSMMRDLLLPRLISGKLRVEDAEAALEAA